MMSDTTRSYSRTLYGANGAFRRSPDYAQAIERHSKKRRSWIDWYVIGGVVVSLALFAAPVFFAA